MSAHSGHGSWAATNAADAGKLVVRDVTGRKLCQSHEELGMTLSTLREESADSLIGRSVRCGAEALQEGVGEATGPDGGRRPFLRHGDRTADGEALARYAARFDVRHDCAVERGLKQLDSVMAGEEQVRDEVHAVIEVDPVGSGASDAIAVTAVKASQQRGQIVHDDRFRSGGVNGWPG